ncbi:M16 family metallopeptidase [Denitrobaculum tricleocarpae]|uniref:Insulinase family protein n=1 Tax=Denitrobaculum tricleocarpae TaxID=2591009 RepID=A0A545U1W4_9PROT|nr:pitrilysin family protein [Denitrobaculum tricleocarpae]TQV83470.1 insulinase family protein [Denitrobaculum tricleocarpae]
MSVEVSTLSNGLRVATDRIDTVETASLGAWVGVGTRHEPAAVNGVAHMLEHMAFKGTKRRSAYAIAEEIEAVGGHMNAYTSRENTAFYARTLAEDVPLAVDIIGDILQSSTFDQEELQRERAVVLQEIGQAADTPDDVIFDYFQETAYPSQALGRPVLGTSEIVGSFQRDTLRDYMANHYGAENMVVAASGKVEHRQFVDLVEAHFGGLSAGTSLEEEKADYRGGEYREKRDLEQVHFLLGFHSVDYHDPDYYAGLVMSTLFGGGMSSRLFQEIREKRGLVYSIYSFASAYSDDGVFGVYAGTGEAQAAEMVPVICEEVLKLCESVSDEEVARAAAQLKASILMSRESSSARCEQLAQQLLVYGRPVTSAEIVERISSIDGAQVVALARRMIASAPTVATIGPIAGVASIDEIGNRLG